MLKVWSLDDVMVSMGPDGRELIYYRHPLDMTVGSQSSVSSLCFLASTR